MEQLKNTTDNNADNIDEIMVNLRVTTENVRQLTDSLKTNPAVLIRGNNVKDRKPGENGEVSFLAREDQCRLQSGRLLPGVDLG